MTNQNDPLVTEDNMYTFYPKIENQRGKNLTGQQYGQLKVLYKTLSEKVGNATKSMWVCKCLYCNNIIKRRGDYLYQNRIISCGCPKPIDIKGQKFNHLTPIKIHSYDKNNGYIWECKCDCGNTSYTSYCRLVNNYTKSCGCERAKSLAKMSQLGSKGELKIVEILQKNKILFERQKTFHDLKDQNLLPVDFYLPYYNCVIEFDGIQHFKYSGTGWDTKEQFEITQKHDKIKNDYCKNKNIILIRIPYYIYDNLSIKDLLPKTSKYII